MNTNDIIGFIGVTITLLAYFLSILKILSPTGKLFYFLNFLGAGIACFASVLIHYTPFVILEGTWSGISLIAFSKAIKTN